MREPNVSPSTTVLLLGIMALKLSLSPGPERPRESDQGLILGLLFPRDSSAGGFEREDRLCSLAVAHQRPERKELPPEELVRPSPNWISEQTKGLC